MFTAGTANLINTLVQAFFYHWAVGNFTEQDTPIMMALMKHLISFFNRFVV
jgi:hypothetical protein